MGVFFVNQTEERTLEKEGLTTSESETKVSRSVLGLMSAVNVQIFEKFAKLACHTHQHKCDLYGRFFVGEMTNL